MNASTVNNLTPTQKVDEIISSVSLMFEEFENDLQQKKIKLQHDDRLVRTNTADYELRGGDVTGLSEEELMILKDRLEITGSGILIEDPNDGQGDLRADDYTIYRTNVPFLVMVRWYYSEAWHGTEKGVRLLIDYKYGQETTGVNLELTPNLEKIKALHDSFVKAEADIILNQIYSKEAETEFSILLWQDKSGLRTNNADYAVRGGDRDGVSKDVEKVILIELGVLEDDMIDCSEATQAGYEIGFPTRTEQFFFPTKHPGVYVLRDNVSGGWHGYEEGVSIVKLSSLPPTLEYNNEHYYDNDEVEEVTDEFGEEITIDFSHLQVTTNRQRVLDKKKRIKYPLVE